MDIFSKIYPIQFQSITYQKNAYSKSNIRILDNFRKILKPLSSI